MSDTTVISAKNAADCLKIAKENGIEFFNFRFSDLQSKMHHVAFPQKQVTEELLNTGFYFDGSSISGWKSINESDMQMKPDVSRISLCPFSAQPTMDIFCDVYEPIAGTPYERDPRSIAKKAEEYLKKTKIADSASFGPEAEFFIFDDVKYKTSQNLIMSQINSTEGPYNSASEIEGGNTGHRPRKKGGYFPEAPIDSESDMRAEMLTVLDSVGVTPEKHHHEVAPSQHELGIMFDTLLKCADNTQLFKHVIHNVAHAYGKTATFMPKPVFGDNGSGMHVHQSLWKGKKPLFAGKEYANLSEDCLFYIGGIIKHARALNAFTNPSTNSYKRLVPGYEAPVILAYSARNRSAACRIPMATSDSGRRVEVRFPDPLANPYLAFSAMMMAGIDGIENKIHPGEASDQNLYELTGEELSKVPQVCGSLRDALSSLKSDHDFLLKGDVFTQNMIEGYIDLKMEEVVKYETMPHPVEFEMYYSS